MQLGQEELQDNGISSLTSPMATVRSVVGFGCRVVQHQRKDRSLRSSPTISTAIASLPVEVQHPAKTCHS
eukprot:scaffold310155_cov23-Prasinocladus_malaysianus.AAC.1